MLRRSNVMRIVVGWAYAQPEPDLIAKAHIYLDRLAGPSAMNTTNIAEAFNVDRPGVGRILRLAFPSPRMLVLTGSRPASLTPRHIARTELPIGWVDRIRFSGTG